MKTILHLANFNLLRLKGCFQNSYPFKITNGLTRNGYAVINYSDRDICRMLGFGSMNFLGKKRSQKHFLNYCRVVKPDALFMGHADTIEAETLYKLKEMLPEIKILQWTCDWVAPGYAQRNIEALQRNKEIVDAFFVTTGDKNQLAQFKTANNKVCYLPNFVDETLETYKAFENSNPEYDLFYSATPGIRQFCGQDIDNEKLVEEISAKVQDLKWLLAGIKGAPKLAGADYIAAFSKAGMGLSLSRVNDVYLYSSDRMVHIMGNGELCFLDKRTGFGDLFADDEIAFYATPEELYEKINKYRTDVEERQKIAENGWRKIQAEYNEKIITKYMADVLFENKTDKKDWQIML
ncbi:MAG: glycosyltransferase [Alphaproteobacteria bacterium]|nr:glycosyltransferase [Alphaproteobacteria bacterium]